MKTYKRIEEAIAENDIPKMRDAVTSLVYVDLDFSEGVMDEQIQYIESKGIKLKEDFLSEDPIISSTKTEFTLDDFADAVINLRNNFCDERIEDLKIISKAVSAKESESAPAEEPKVTPEPNPTPAQTPSGHSGGEGSPKKRGFGPFVAIAAIIAAVIALFKGCHK